MLYCMPTKNLTGITVRGDYKDFYDLVDSIHRMTWDCDNQTAVYFGVKSRLLGLCYDIRHAYMGDRDIVWEENGMSQDMMEWHNIITPTRTVYFSVIILFPEAIFVAAAVPGTYPFALRHLETLRKDTAADHGQPALLFSEYLRDVANLDVLCAGIWQALGQAVGDTELEKIVRLMQRSNESYMNYATHYIDRCNIELLNTEFDRRKDKLRNIAKRIVKKPQGYRSLEEALRRSAKIHKTTIYELYEPDLEYPEDIVW